MPSTKLTRAPQRIEPIVIGCYTLHETGITVRGRPSFGEHQGVGDFIKRAHKASGWWVADWLRYGESRPDWRERLSQVVDAADIREKTARNLKYIGENVPPSRRRGDVDLSLHAEVAPLHPKDQERWLERAATEGWSTRELRQHIRASQRVKVIEGQARLEGQYRIIYADPPWRYSDSGATADGSLGKAERHYPGMTIGELCGLPVAAHATPHATLFCWATTPLLLQNPGPREVLEAWGFTYKSEIVWDKVLGMPGHYALDVTHEHLLIAVRGNGQPDVPTPHSKSVLVERRSDTHSEKPESVRRWIVKHWTRGPYLELFGRRRVEGWTVFGNDSRLWAREARTA